MKDIIIRYKWKLLGVLLGALVGFAYWYFIGCESGTCPIQSKWENSTMYGGLIGLVLANGPSKKGNKESTDKKTEEDKVKF